MGARIGGHMRFIPSFSLVLLDERNAIHLITTLQVWRAPDELLAQHRSTYDPPVPQGGWQAAVSAAAAARGDGDTQPAALLSQPSFQGAPTLSIHPS